MDFIKSWWLQNFDFIDIPLSAAYEVVAPCKHKRAACLVLAMIFHEEKKKIKNCNILQKGKILLGGLPDKAIHALEIQTCFTTNSFIKKEAISEPETHEHKHSQTIYNSVP